MRTEIKSGALADYEYTYPENDDGPVCYLSRCIPHDGVSLYRIHATYAKTKEPSVYYILGRNVNDARRRFREMYSWLSIVLVRHVDPAGAESVLTDYKKMPV